MIAAVIARLGGSDGFPGGDVDRLGGSDGFLPGDGGGRDGNLGDAKGPGSGELDRGKLDARDGVFGGDARGEGLGRSGAEVLYALNPVPGRNVLDAVRRLGLGGGLEGNRGRFDSELLGM